MLKEVLEFLSSNSVLIIGSASVIAELIIIAVNLIRRLTDPKINLESINQVPSTGFSNFFKSSFWGHLWWSANPLNLFRNP